MTATATLLVLPAPDDARWRAVWSFDHQMVHDQMLAQLAPQTQFSAAPYFVEPLPAPVPPFPTPADMWNLKHQSAHDDFNQRVATGPFVGIPLNQNLVDSNLNAPEDRTWWTFANHQEHYIISAMIAPLPT